MTNAEIVGLTGIEFRRGGREPDVADWRAAVVDERMRLVRESAGDRYERLELNGLVQRVIVTDDRRQAAEELARGWPQLTPDEILASPLCAHQDRGADRRRREGAPRALGHLLPHHARTVHGSARADRGAPRGPLTARPRWSREASIIVGALCEPNRCHRRADI